MFADLKTWRVTGLIIPMALPLPGSSRPQSDDELFAHLHSSLTICIEAKDDVPIAILLCVH
jgi:hypothetical protein